jgi:hypothetical protein
MTEMTDRHYRVLRFTPSAGHGVLRDVLAENLSLDEAREVAKQNAPVVHDEEVVIEDQLRIGLDAQVEQTNV